MLPMTTSEPITTAAETAPEIGVGIVTYNSADHISDLIRTLRETLEGFSHRIVVADNASEDTTVAQLEDAGIEVVRMGSNRGYSAGINACLRSLADARAVLILNPDIKLGSGSVSALLAALDDPRVGVVAPQSRDYGGGLALPHRRDPSLLRAVGTTVLGGRYSRRFAALSEFVADEQSYMHARNIHWGVGAVLLVSR